MINPVVIVIPARMNSKGIPFKNLKPLADFPLVEWAVAAALKADIGPVVVTTDSKDILLLLARSWRRVLAIQRPDELAQDDTSDLPVFDHLLSMLTDVSDDAVLVHLRPTSPFVMPGEIVEVAERCAVAGVSVRSVVVPRHHPKKMYGVAPVPEGVGGAPPYTLRPYTTDHAANRPRQLLGPVFAAAGFVDAVPARTVRYSHAMESASIVPWFAPAYRAVDLDTEADWAGAEALARSCGWRPGEVG